MSKVIEFKPNIPDGSVFTKNEIPTSLETQFQESYKLKNVTANVPDYIPKNEFECYVRYVDGATYKLFVYLGKDVGWKSTTLS